MNPRCRPCAQLGRLRPAQRLKCEVIHIAALRPRQVATRVLLIRHTAVAVATGICYGQTDVPLADTFEQELASLRQRLPDLVAATSQIFSSPAQRCVTLANELRRTGLSTEGNVIVTDERLREMNFGQWEGRAWDDIPRDAIDAWNSDLKHGAPHGGESLDDLQKRAVEALSDYLNQATGDLLLFTHGGVVRTLVAWALDLPLEHCVRLKVDFGSTSELVISGGYKQLRYLNR